MKTAIAILLLLFFASPVFAQQADVAETYADIGIPAPEEGMGQPSGFHGIAGHYRLSDSWSLLGGLFETRYGNGIVDSPIVTLRYQTLMFFGAGWRF